MQSESIFTKQIDSGDGGPPPVWGNFWVYVSRAFCLEKILYFLISLIL